MFKFVFMKGRCGLVIFIYLLGLSSAGAEVLGLGAPEPNRVILSILPTMPNGGGYSAAGSATRNLQSAAQVRGGKLNIQPAVARPTYCSGATYLVFLRVLEAYSPGSTITGALAETLSIKGQPDGAGVWGRWNANGPGTACLFHELSIGRNFTSFEDARPGDFMKIFWTDPVGRREHGHSVIYLGKETVNGVEMVRFWSSNQPNGYGEKSVPRTKIAHAIFSRLDSPQKINKALLMPGRNSYLAGLLTHDSSISEAADQSGAR
jgi:hypothetical protein